MKHLGLFAITLVLISPLYARDTISIVGSSTVYPFATAVVEQFANKTGLATPTLKSTGSGGGMKLFCSGIGKEHPDITNASRRIKAKEVKLCADNGITNVTEVKIGYDGIVILSSLDAPKLSLTKEMIFKALSKEIKPGVKNSHKRWSDISTELPDMPIRVMGPPPSSGTRDAFEEIVLEKLAKEHGVALAIREDGAYIEAGENDNLITEKLVDDKSLLGIAGFSFLDQNIDRLQGALIDGVEPTFENIADGAYGVSRSLFFYVKNDHIDVIDGLEAYVAEFTHEDTWGEEGYLTDLGLIPLGTEERIAPLLGKANGPFAKDMGK